MSKYLNFFDDVYYINLDSRTDRRQKFEERSKSVGIDAIRFSAIQPTIEECSYMFFWNIKDSQSKANEVGCALSHLSIIKEAKERNLENVLIFEDDCVFLENFKEEVENCVNDLKNIEWDIMYFGGEPNDYCEKITDNLYTIKHGGIYGTQSYAVNKNFYDKILSNMEPKFNKLKNKSEGYDGIVIIAIDQFLLNYHMNRNYFLSKKLLTIQETNYSDIRGHIVETSNFINGWNKFVLNI